jgi:hypothetical protein
MQRKVETLVLLFLVDPQPDQGPDDVPVHLLCPQS